MKIREATAADVDEAGRIIYAAFKGIAEQHNFPTDFPTPESAVRSARFSIAHEQCYGVVAEAEGHLLGSAYAHERDPIVGVGPVSVDPRAQAGGVGKALMRALLEHTAGAAGVRLVQDAFNTTSMPLYASLGFEAREPLVLVSGTPKAEPTADIEVRPMTEADLDTCGALCERVHGFPRTGELRDGLGRFAPAVAVRGGRIVAYSSGLSMRGHGVAESDEAMQALISDAAAFAPEQPALLLPIRQASFFRWALAAGMRVVKPCTLMTIGAYQEPAGCYFPSILY
ncbi:MAG TPA: GNAT family N-acetyltransferase [Dehalococcoidia bacterium]|nr:GNAT family N-acetyltransferase [Dehalococcoidia bacterium]